MDNDDFSMRERIIVKWCRFLNEILGKLHLKKPVPSCFGHMYCSARWIRGQKNNETSNQHEQALRENASRVASCISCSLDSKCFHFSMASYAFQSIPDERRTIAGRKGENDDE